MGWSDDDDSAVDDDSWVERERQAAGPCPWCGAQQVQPIVYGFPDPAAFGRLQGQVRFAGCTVPEVPMRFRCAACGTEWAHAAERGR